MALIVFATFLLSPPIVRAQISVLPTSDFAWVDLTTIAPTIRIELRYATSENIAHRPLYPSRMQPLIRAGVARRLITAQAILRRYNCGLKIWDAYRPRDAQAQLWRLAPRNDYVVNPHGGSGSFHSWGVAVDATLVDDWGRPLSMPTDFDDFTQRRCSVTLAAIRSCAITCIFCKQQWRTPASMDCAPNGGISLLVTGSVTFQNGLRSLVTPSSSPQLNDRLSSRPPAATGIRSHPHQSSTDLRLGDKLDRIDHCIFSSERPAQIATLTLVLISAAAAWPVYEFGEEGYDRVLSMTDDDGHAWLDEHQRRAELLIYFFYALAGLSAVAIAVPIKWPKTSTSLVITTILLGAVVLGMGATSPTPAVKFGTGNFEPSRHRRNRPRGSRAKGRSPNFHARQWLTN